MKPYHATLQKCLACHATYQIQTRAQRRPLTP